MITVSRILLIVAGILLVVDAVLMATDTPNPAFGWPLPCPISLTVLGVGLILFAAGSRAFRRE